MLAYIIYDLKEKGNGRLPDNCNILQKQLRNTKNMIQYNGIAVWIAEHQKYTLIFNQNAL